MAIPSERVEEQPPTPPHHPTYGVRLLDEEIKDLINDALQEGVETIEQLPSGQSFNNRIYFLGLSSKSKSPHKEGFISNRVVLKIPGWNFGTNKIQNEVINLLQLEKHCPQIPVPRILAWSEGGDNIQQIKRLDDCVSSLGDRLSAVLHILSHKPRTSSRIRDSRGWILMTRLPGQTLQPSKIEPHNVDGVMQQLAEYVSQWRGIPSPTQQIGNLRYVGPSSDNLTSWNSTSTLLFDQRIAVSGLLVGFAPSPMRSSQEYYTMKLCGELAILKDNENYAPNRTTLVPLLEELLGEILPNTTLFRRNQGYDTVSTFTHYDFSPRNILVSESDERKLQVSGIVDFEFSGFFPIEEEFTNTCIAGEGDWPPQAWESFVKHLGAWGVRVPRGEVWDQACALVRIIDNIAPWQLREGGVEGEALETALRQARLKTEENVALLKQVSFVHYC